MPEEILVDRQAKSDHYREHAKNLRMLAAQDDNAGTREALLDVALNYDRLSARFAGPARAL
jgi:hypothetical protein